MTDAAAAASVYVHVSGAVAAPGLYVLDDGARVVDAVAAAGGFAADGATRRPSTSRVRSATASSCTCPSSGDQPVAGAPGAGGDGQGQPQHRRCRRQLDTLPRIGPAMAERIIEWRDANGRFTSVEDLLAVPGIGDKMLETLRDLVTV